MINPKSIDSWSKWFEAFGFLLITSALCVGFGVIMFSVIFEKPEGIAIGFIVASVLLLCSMHIERFVKMP